MTHAPHVLVSGVCLGQPMGGVRRHNQELLPRLSALLRAGGGSLTIMEGTTPIAFPLPDTIERLRSDVPFQPAPRRAFFESRALESALSCAAAEGRPFDLVHTAHMPAPRRLSMPFTLTIHDLRSLDLDRAPFVRRLIGGRVIGGATRDARRILCVSDAMRARIEEEFPHARGKVVVIGNGVDHLPVLERDPTNPPFLVHVGHLEPRKNLELLLHALASDAGLPRLVLAGTAKGGTLDELLAIAAELDVADRVTTITAADDDELARLYATAACAVFPSRLEGFGIGPAEALRARCPVAVSDIPAHREVVGDAVPSFAVDDAEGAVQAIRRALRSDAPAAPEHTWDACAERWFAALVAATAD